jgi:hypothetical protein
MMENYLRILQTSTRNFFNLEDTMSLHNSLLYELLISLKSRRKTLSQLSIGSKQDLSISNSEENKISTNQAPTIYFYVSQVIQTPDGIGTVISIDQQKQSLMIYFPDTPYSESNNSPPPPAATAATATHIAAYLHSTKEYSCLSLYNYAKERSQVNLDAYHLSNLEKKWSYESILSEIPLKTMTPFQHNLKEIHKLTEEDLSSLIQPSLPTPSQPPPQDPIQSTNGGSHSSKKTKRNSKSNSQEEISPNVPAHPPMTLASPLSVPLRATDQHKTNKSSSRQSQLSSLLFLKPGTLPYVVEQLQPDDSMLGSHQPTSSSSHLSVELSAQAYSSSTYTHHALPNLYDDSLFESIGFEVESSSTDQTVHPSAETELIKTQEYLLPLSSPYLFSRILKPLLDKIRQCREETKLAALQVERSKVGAIRQSLEISSLRLGLFTHQLLMKSAAATVDLPCLTSLFSFSLLS